MGWTDKYAEVTANAGTAKRLRAYQNHGHDTGHNDVFEKNYVDQNHILLSFYYQNINNSQRYHHQAIHRG